MKRHWFENLAQGITEEVQRMDNGAGELETYLIKSTIYK